MAGLFSWTNDMPQYFSPVGNSQITDANGDPLTGGQIETWLAQSSTPAATYTDESGLVQQSNPIILNSLGYPTLGPIWLTGGIKYKFIIKTSLGVTLRTIDNIAGINDASVSQSEWVESGLTPTYISAVSFSVPGDQTGDLQINRRLRTQNTSGFVYSSITASVFSAGVTTVTVANTSGVLDAGLSSVAYGQLSATNPSIPESAIGTLLRTAATTTAARAAIGAIGLLIGRIYYTCPTHTVAISNGAPAVVTSAADARPATGSPVVLSTSGTLPAPLVAGTVYWYASTGAATGNLSLTKGGAVINTTTTGSGTHTMTNAPYVKATNNPSFVNVRVQGAGGGSGGGSIAAAGSGGGGAGGYSERIVQASALAASETVTVGAGGTAGANTGTNGGTGGTSSFGALATATGGVGGQGTTSNTVAKVGSAGGVGASGDLNLTGNAGGAVLPGNSTDGYPPGEGGASMFGGVAVVPVITGAAAAQPAANNSGSGANGGVAATVTAFAGAVGGSGIVIVEEFA